MKRIISMLIVIMFMCWPLLISAETECTFKIESPKESYAPGEEITIIYGVSNLPDNAKLSGYEFVVSYDVKNFELVEQNNKFVKNLIDWENNEIKELNDENWSNEYFRFIMTKSSTSDSNKYLSNGISNQNLGTIKLRVKDKISTNVATVGLTPGYYIENSSEISPSSYELSENNIINSYPCNQENELSLNIVNQVNDAILNNLVITHTGTETGTVVVEDLNKINMEIIVPLETSSIEIEAGCSGECDITYNKTYNIEDATNIPIKIETSTSVKTYYLSIYNFGQPESLKDKVIIVEDENEEPNMYLIGLIISLVCIAISIVCLTLIIILYIKQKKTKENSKSKKSVSKK